MEQLNGILLTLAIIQLISLGILVFIFTLIKWVIEDVRDWAFIQNNILRLQKGMEELEREK